MKTKTIILAVAGAFAFIIIVVVVRLMSRDGADQRYDAMAIGMEDHCKRSTSGDKCKAFANCYRAGIEKAFPKDLILKVIDGKLAQSQIPQPVERAVRTLERDCGNSVGLKVQ